MMKECELVGSCVSDARYDRGKLQGALDVNELERLRDALRDFASERDWDQFHSPKNLAMALSVEVAELVEHFQWQPEGRSLLPGPEALNAGREELADVWLNLKRIADRLGFAWAQ